MRKLLSLILAVITLYSFAFSVSARIKLVDNVYFSVHGDLEAYFYADELIENGSLLIYKDNKTGYTATIELVDEYIDDNYTAKIHFKDGMAYTKFYFTFNTTSNKIINTRSMSVNYPFRNDVKLDSERNLNIEETDLGSRAWICFSSKTKYSYAEQSCFVELRDKGLFYINRSVLDSHIKGGYDGHSLILFIDKYFKYFVLALLLLIVFITTKLKNKKVSA